MTVLRWASSVCISFCPHQITWSLVVWGWRGKLVGGKHSACSSNCFLSVSKTLSDNSKHCAMLFKHWSKLECQTFLTKWFIAKRDIISRVIECCDEDRQCTPTPNRIDVSGTGITLPGCANVSEAAAGLCWLQLCAELGSSGIRLSEEQYTSSSLMLAICIVLETTQNFWAGWCYEVAFRYCPICVGFLWNFWSKYSFLLL
jgi:hypothetical protein